MCTTIEHLLQDVQSLRNDEQKGTVVHHLLLEVERLINTKTIAVNRSRKQNSVTRLFEIQYSDYTPFIIRTICGSGGAQVKCYEDCMGKKAKKVVKEIQSVCEFLNWHVETDRIGGRCVHEMKIGCFIQKDDAP